MRHNTTVVWFKWTHSLNTIQNIQNVLSIKKMWTSLFEYETIMIKTVTKNYN
jgi:hypothetical protein